MIKDAFPSISFLSPSPIIHPTISSFLQLGHLEGHRDTRFQIQLPHSHILIRTPRRTRIRGRSRQSKLATPLLRILRTRQSRFIQMLILMRQRNPQRSPLRIIHSKCQLRTMLRHIVRPSRPHHQPLPLLIIRISRPFQNDKYRRNTQCRQRNIFPRITRYNHHFKFPRGGSIPHNTIISIRRSTCINRRSTHRIRQHVDQIIHIFKFRC
mmetsp:Transcript_25842/g.39684  ORF Transcript_25842/g.39684 Transcript_25842/m.39684 type:complete len:210 (+) Transcript_25842:716-1345(+)